MYVLGEAGRWFDHGFSPPVPFISIFRSAIHSRPNQFPTNPCLKSHTAISLPARVDQTIPHMSMFAMPRRAHLQLQPLHPWWPWYKGYNVDSSSLVQTMTHLWQRYLCIWLSSLVILFWLTLSR